MDGKHAIGSAPRWREGKGLEQPHKPPSRLSGASLMPAPCLPDAETCVLGGHRLRLAPALSGQGSCMLSKGR